MQFVLQSLQVPRSLQQVLGEDLLLLSGVGRHSDGVPDLNQNGLMEGGRTVQVSPGHYVFITISGCQNMSSFYFICRGTTNNIKHKCGHFTHCTRVSLEVIYICSPISLQRFTSSNFPRATLIYD